MKKIYTITELNQHVRQLLEHTFPLVCVQGEISNLSRPGSGHLYFSLKDSQSQIRCAFFLNRQRAPFKLENGMLVCVEARPSVYEGRGDFQLIIETLNEVGDGALQRAFLALKEKLNAEKLFDSSRKKPLPAFPRHIGLITSPTGAAIQDILTVLNARLPVPILIYPSLVQGAQSSHSLVNAIELANQDNLVDVIILARGGGSLEDLWGFNTESIARAIASSQIPIISAVGHEVDFTIADFVADCRAPTPSAGAALIAPSKQELSRSVLTLYRKLSQMMQFNLQTKAHDLKLTTLRLKHPGQRLQDQMQRTDELLTRLNFAIKTYLKTQTQRLTTLSRTLDATSPLNTLKRGYAIATDKDGKVIETSKNVTLNDSINILLHEGRVICEVKATS